MSKVTDNARLLLGYVAGLMMRTDAGEQPTYTLESVDAANGTQVVEHRYSGNTYRVSVEQLTGPEHAEREP